MWQIAQGPVFSYFFPSRPAVEQLLVDLAVWTITGGLILFLASQWNLLRFVALIGGASLILWNWSLLYQSGWYGRNDPIFLGALLLVEVLFGLAIFRYRTFRQAIEFVVVIVFLFTASRSAMVWMEARKLPTQLPSRVGEIFFEQSGNAVAGTPEISGLNTVRLIWLVFDELDEHITFEAGFRYPAFQKVASESLRATALSPSHYRTLAAIPSMLRGQEMSMNEVLQSITNRTEGNTAWEKDNLFSEFKRAGLRSAVLGWYQPYCSLFGGVLTACYTAQWDTAGTASYLAGAPLSRRIRKDLGEIARGFPGAVPLYRKFIRGSGENGTAEAILAHRQIFDEIASRLEPVLTGPYDFIFVHLPVPHTPGILLAKGIPGGDYLDNMVIADETLGFIRELLVKKGIWDRSTVLVTGDHHFRYDIWHDQSTRRTSNASRWREDPRTVFLLKLPGDKTGSTYGKPFNALLLHDLLLAGKRLATRAGVIEWLDTNRGRFPVGDPSHL